MTTIGVRDWSPRGATTSASQAAPTALGATESPAPITAAVQTNSAPQRILMRTGAKPETAAGRSTTPVFFHVDDGTTATRDHAFADQGVGQLVQG
jgi:hypothetical protein